MTNKQELMGAAKLITMYLFVKMKEHIYPLITKVITQLVNIFLRAIYRFQNHIDDYICTI